MMNAIQRHGLRGAIATFVACACVTGSERIAAAQALASEPVSSSSASQDVKLSPRSVKLFDQRRMIVSFELAAGPIWTRRVQDETPLTRRRNFTRGAPLAGEIAVGVVSTTAPGRGPFFLTGHTKTLLRVLDDKSFSWSLFDHELGGGLRLGPLEPEARMRLGTVTADIIHAQPSIQLLTPGVSAGVGIHMGKFRLDIASHAEYLWRWFGPDYLVRGVTIGLRFDQDRPKTPFPESSAPQ